MTDERRTSRELIRYERGITRAAASCSAGIRSSITESDGVGSTRGISGGRSMADRGEDLADADAIDLVGPWDI